MFQLKKKIKNYEYINNKIKIKIILGRIAYCARFRLGPLPEAPVVETILKPGGS